MFTITRNDPGVREIVSPANTFADTHGLEAGPHFAGTMVYGLVQDHETHIKLSPALHVRMAAWIPSLVEKTGLTVGVRAAQGSQNAIGIRLDVRQDRELRKKAQWFLQFSALAFAGVVVNARGGRTSESDARQSAYPESIDEPTLTPPMGTVAFDLSRIFGHAARETQDRAIGRVIGRDANRAYEVDWEFNEGRQDNEEAR